MTDEPEPETLDDMIRTTLSDRQQQPREVLFPTIEPAEVGENDEETEPDD